MKRGRCFILGLLIVMLSGQLLIDSSGVQTGTSTELENQLFQDQNDGGHQAKDLLGDGNGKFSVSEDPMTGYLNPAGIEQRGYRLTDNLNARTDTGVNSTTSIAIDNETGWVGSEAEVQITNLQRLYAVNGTFDDGIDGTNTYPGSTTAYPYGWDVIYDEPGVGSQQVQEATYDKTNGYVSVENQGRERTSPSLLYWHYNNTYIIWNQTVQNVPYSNNFTMSLRFNYESGVIDNVDYFIPYGEHVYLVAYVYDSFYLITDLLAVEERETWYTETLQFNVTDGIDSFEIGFGIYFLTYYDDYIEFNPGGDWDDDGAIDGDLCRVFRVLLDDISFVGLDSPGFDEVDLQFNAGTQNTAITGTSGNGSAILTNYSYWSQSSLPVEITSNVSVSFEHQTTLLSHHFGNSSWTTHPTKEGTTYSITAGQSADLTTYTYVGAVSDYVNYTIYMRMSDDWENVTIYDPFLNDVTSQCSIVVGQITIPTSLLDRLGWWQITLESPNYAKTIATQRYEQGSGLWTDTTIFGSGNTTRTQVEVGTATSTTVLNNPVNTSWILPNDTTWVEDSVTDIGTSVNSSSFVLGGANTTAGLWTVDVYWSNGTEVAYDQTTFEMHHTATLTPVNLEIDTDAGVIVSNFLYYVDIDNGEYLMEDLATIVGNWSGADVTFTRNLIENWWQGNFDTSLMDGGSYVVVVNASRPYFGNVSCQFTITTTFQTSFELLGIGSSPIEIGMNENYTIHLSYELTNGTGISDGLIQVDYSGPQNGLTNSTQAYQGNGRYSINMWGLKSGTYTVIVNISKAYHYTGSDTFTLIVGKINTVLTSLNGTADFVQVEDGYRFVVQFNNISGYGVTGASVDVIDVSPVFGLSYATFSDIGGGNYSIILTPTSVTSFTVVVSASIANHETQTITFTLTATEIQTTLTANITSATIGISETLVVQMSFADDVFQGITTATISIVNPPSELDFIISEVSDGNYTITINPLLTGTYLVTVSATLTNHEEGITSFSVIVQDTWTTLQILNGTSDLVQVGENYDLVLLFSNSTGYGLTGATLQVTDITPAVGLSNGTISDDGGGYYSFNLTPSIVQTFSITIKANLTNHVMQITTFTLTSTAISSSLTANLTTASLLVGETVVVQISFEDESLQGITGATISVIDPPTGLDFTISEMSQGNYSIIVDTLLSGSYLVSVSASRTNYQDGLTSFFVIVDEIGTTLQLVNGTSGLTKVNDGYWLVVNYANITGYGLLSADVQVTDVSPAVGLTFGFFSEEGNGNYSITLTPVSVGTYVVTIKANITNHATQFVAFTLTATEIDTILTLNVSSVSSSVGMQEVVRVSFTDGDLLGLIGATVSIVDPPVGLGFLIDEVSDGNYTITIDLLIPGSYLVTVSATLNNYKDGSTSFFVSVDEIGTTLLVLNGTSDLVRVLDDYTLVLDYTNSTGSGLSLADLVVTDISPSSGLSYGTFTDYGDGTYSIILTPSTIDTFTLTIRANLTNHVTQIKTFTLTSTEITTGLTLNISSVTVSVGEVFVIQASYANNDLTGITDANLTIINPPSGLGFGISEVGNGNYTITVNPSLSGSYLVTVSATKDNYQDGIVSFSVIVDMLYTTLDLINGTSDLIRFGENYSLVLMYGNGTGYGLTGADVAILSIDPMTGLTVDSISEIGNGYYKLHFVPTSASTFTILLRTNLTNYLDRTATFTLTVTDIPTVLTLDRSGATISVDKDCTIQLSFQDDLGLGIDSAAISVLNPPEGLSFSSVLALGNGLYNITIDPTIVGTYQIAFRSTLESYQNSTVGFTLIVISIPTTLDIVEGMSQASIIYKDEYSVTLSYVRTDTNVNITSADFTVSFSPSEGINWSILMVGELYRLVISTDSIGIWKFFITANKTGHVSGIIELNLEVLSISTTINDFAFLEPLIFGRSYNLTYNYLMTNGSGISGAGLIISGSAAQWIEVQEVVAGHYFVSFTPQDLGSYVIQLTFSRDGFDSKSSELSFTVNPVPIQIIDVQGLSAVEGEDTTISLRLVESDTGQPVSGADVQIQIIIDSIMIDTYDLEEVGSGEYSITITMPEYQSDVSIKVIVDHAHHEMNVEFYETPLNLSESETLATYRMLSSFIPLIAVAIVGAVGFVGRRAYTRRKREQYIEAMLIKRRFDDIQSLLGVIVLHKHSGIPVYSKIVKGGLDEALISGFISAITQFREEFDVDHSDSRIVPISDIIRVVATENLLCAFITFTAPSKAQELRMIEFAETVGFVFDSLFTEPPTMALEQGTLQQFENLFDDILDGRLLKKFKIQEIKALPRDTKCLDDRIRALAQKECFEIQELADSIAACGLEEAHIYKVILDAIEEEQLVTVAEEVEEKEDIAW